jgi:hypothetical protein
VSVRRAGALLLALAALSAGVAGSAPAAGSKAPATGTSPAALPQSTEAAGARSVAVTVYNDNLGVVKDQRKFAVASGVSELRFTDVASSIDPTSVHLSPLGRTPLEILWQDYRFDLVSTDKLLEKYVDQPIDVSTKDDQVKRGTLLSFDPSSLVIQEPGGGLSLLNRSEVRQVGLKELPKGLITRPTLVWRLRSGAAAEEPLELSYMTGGMSWHAEYVAVLQDGAARLDLQGWASVENRSGATYENAKIKLVAGSIHRAPPPQAPMPRFDMMAAKATMEVAERGFFEYHLYELPLAATLSNNEVKQIGLLQTSGIPCAKKFTYDASKDPDKVLVTVEFQNASASGLGMALPAGIVRVFQTDKDGSLELAGEDRIQHTPKNETVRIAVGSAFDIAVERKQTAMSKVTPRLVETSYEITLRNHKTETVDVAVVEHASGDWQIVESSLPATKKDATTFEFAARCAPEKPVVITYTLRTKT